MPTHPLISPLPTALPSLHPTSLPLCCQAELESLKTAVAREKHSREAQQKKCAELEASLRRWVGRG